MSASTILGPDGLPFDRSVLRRVEAGATTTGVRSTDALDPSTGLTPERLAALLRASEDGDPASYFELAERIEEKELHYVSVLRTRRLAVSALEPVVEAASDDAADVAIADFVREIVLGDAVRSSLFDILDAIGKGISVTEIVWDLSGGQWVPDRLAWVDQRWIEFDRTDRRTPMLRSGPGEPGAGTLPAGKTPDTAGPPGPHLKPLAPFKFIVCNIQSKSGLPVRGGLARPVAWAYLFKNFDLKAWVQFAEVYGQPLRVGKYHPGASDEEKRTLLRALANIASDAAAMVPQSMAVEFVEASGNRDGAMFEKMAVYLDLQISKAVLGQTGTTDAVAGGYAVGKVQNEVRSDIRDADSNALAMTLKRDLVKPLVDLNFGPTGNDGRKRRYPNLRFQTPEQFDVTVMSDALVKLVPLGLQVEASLVRDKLGFGDPKQGAVLLKAPAASPPSFGTPGFGAPVPASGDALARAFHAVAAQQAADTRDETARIAAKLAAAADPAIAAQLARIEAAVANAGSFDDLSDALLGLAGELSADDFAAAMRDGLVLAHLSGAASVPAIAKKRKP